MLRLRKPCTRCAAPVELIRQSTGIWRGRELHVTYYVMCLACKLEGNRFDKPKFAFDDWMKDD